MIKTQFTIIDSLLFTTRIAGHDQEGARSGMKRSGPLKRGKWKRYIVKGDRKQRSSSLRPRSKKTSARERAAAGVRRSWVNATGRICMICGHGPFNPNPKYPPSLSKVVCHEIANGYGRRLRALDQPCAVLCLCRACNEIEVVDKSKWPEQRQLAVLLARAPERYDLPAFIQLTSPAAPNRITQDEVDAYMETI